MKLAVFASGSGTNFENLVKQGIPITFLFADQREAKALARAEKLGIQAHTFALKEFENKAAYETALLKLLAQYDIDLIVLAGYMKIVSPTLLQAYEGRILNIHPAYLPEFPGAHGIEDAWRAGVTESGDYPLCRRRRGYRSDYRARAGTDFARRHPRNLRSQDP